MPPGTLQSVLIERRLIGGGPAVAATVVLNRPEELNPIDTATAIELRSAVVDLSDETEVRVIFMTGAGRAFSAGGDVKRALELQREPAEFDAFLHAVHQLFQAVARCRVPVIALVNGIAAGGGTELILFCDLAIASDAARIGDGHQNLGLMGGGGGLAMLPLVVGPARARELILTGRLLDAQEACEWGLVSRVVPAEGLQAAADELAGVLAAKSPLAVTRAKQILNAAFWSGADVSTRMDLEREAALRYCLTTHDSTEGLRAFGEKRPPRFTGR